MGKGGNSMVFVHLPINGRAQGWASTGLYARQCHTASGWLTIPINDCNRSNRISKGGSIVSLKSHTGLLLSCMLCDVTLSNED